VYGSGVDNPEITLEALQAALDEDILDPEAYTNEEICQMIREAGGDPDEIARRGQKFVAELLVKHKLVRTFNKMLLGAVMRGDKDSAKAALTNLARIAGCPEVLK